MVSLKQQLDDLPSQSEIAQYVFFLVACTSFSTLKLNYLENGFSGPQFFPQFMFGILPPQLS